MSKRSKKRKNRTSGSPTWMVSGSIGKWDRAESDKWRNRGFYSSGKNSEVKRIDPETGLVLTADVIEIAANEILRDDAKRALIQSRQPKIRKPKMKAKNRQKAAKPPTVETKDTFYRSWDWRTLRMRAFKQYGRACQCCGAEPGARNAAGQRIYIQVDHIKPISKYWNLRLDINNLQILCDECNQGKGNWDETDFRSKEPDEWAEDQFEDIALDVLASMAPANGRAMQ